MEERTDDDTLRLSKYNTSGFINLRLNDLWIKANNETLKGNYHQWNFILDVIYRELTRDFNKDSPQEKEFNKINDEIRKLLPLARPFTPDFNKKTGLSESIKSKQYFWLDKKDVFLRRLENSVGKGSSYKDEDEDDFD